MMHDRLSTERQLVDLLKHPDEFEAFMIGCRSLVEFVEYVGFEDVGRHYRRLMGPIENRNNRGYFR